MAKFELNLPATFDIASRGKSVTIDPSKLTADILTQLVLHGLSQKVSDAAAGAKKIAEEGGGDAADIGKGLMQKVVDSLVAGEWGTRREASGVSEETRVIRVVLGEQLRAAKAWDKYKDLEGEERGKALDALFAKQGQATKDKLMLVVNARIAEAKEKAAQARAMASELAL